jgi:hypothetical protein
MKTGRIRVKVRPGTFSSERSVSFEAGGKQYALIVDEADVRDDTLEVRVIAESGEEAVVDLPRDTFTSGNRIRIPASCLLPVSGEA